MFKERLTYIIIIVVLSIFAWTQWTKEPIKVVEQIVKTDSIYTFKVDTFYPDPVRIIIRDTVPKFVYLKDTIIKNYNDSLITPEFKVFINDQVKGTLINRWFEYVNLTPVRIETTGEKVITEVKYVDVIKPAPVIGNYIGTGISYNYKDTSINFGINYVRYNNKKAWSIGYDLDGTFRGGLMVRF
jgi:hypothetical protein